MAKRYIGGGGMRRIYSTNGNMVDTLMAVIFVCLTFFGPLVGPSDLALFIWAIHWLVLT